MRALFQHDTLIGGNAQCHQRRNSVSEGDAHKRTLKRELQWLSTLCHRLGVTRARCSTSELLQLQCYEGYAMKNAYEALSACLEMQCLPLVYYWSTL